MALKVVSNTACRTDFAQIKDSLPSVIMSSERSAAVVVFKFGRCIAIRFGFGFGFGFGFDFDFGFDFGFGFGFGFGFHHMRVFDSR